jgi:hypothetical protein
MFARSSSIFKMEDGGNLFLRDIVVQMEVIYFSDISLSSHEITDANWEDRKLNIPTWSHELG